MLGTREEISIIQRENFHSKISFNDLDIILLEDKLEVERC